MPASASRWKAGSSRTGPRELARQAAATRGLDGTFVLRDGTTRNLRWIYLHMFEEYARHNGHADILREQIDGVTGD